MTLTIATVVRNDLDGLRKTLESGRRWLGSIEWWVIDGSSDSSIRTYLSGHADGIRWISETDDGIYDAMNKALDRATGDYILFINAGDTLHRSFDPFAFLTSAPQSPGVLLGRVVEVAGNERYLRPGLGQEDTVFVAPPHQATFYPRLHYSQNRYCREQKIGADGTYTAAAIRTVGATFIPATVAEFYTGGVSSSYGSWTTLKQRFFEGRSPLDKAKIVIKAVMWRVLPRSLFYRALASRNKYTPLQPGQDVFGSGGVLHKPPASPPYR